MAPATGGTQVAYSDITEQQGSVDGFVGALEDASVDRCEANAEGWVGEGTVTNNTDTTPSYRLYIAFNDHRDTQGLIQVDLPDVAPGDHTSWMAEAPLPGPDLSCVLRVERFPS